MLEKMEQNVLKNTKDKLSTGFKELSTAFLLIVDQLLKGCWPILRIDQLFLS